MLLHIAGSVLSGDEQFVKCDGERVDVTTRGFTYSFLVKLKDFSPTDPLTLLAFGYETDRPSVSLEKPWW